MQRVQHLVHMAEVSRSVVEAAEGVDEDGAMYDMVNSFRFLGDVCVEGGSDAAAPARVGVRESHSGTVPFPRYKTPAMKTNGQVFRIY